jgi:hypothetical protein
MCYPCAWTKLLPMCLDRTPSPANLPCQRQNLRPLIDLQCSWGVLPSMEQYASLVHLVRTGVAFWGDVLRFLRASLWSRAALAAKNLFLIDTGLPYLKLANNTEPFEAGVTWRACQQIGRAGQSSCGPQGSTAASISKGNRVGSWDTASLLTRFSHPVDAAKQTGCHATAPLARRLGNMSRCWAQDVSRRTGSRQSDALIDFPVFAHYSIFLTNPR